MTAAAKRRRKRNRRIKLIIGTILTVAVIIYLGIAIYFCGHFAFNTTVNGQDAYKTTVQDQKDQVIEESGNYVLTIHGRDDVTATITSEQLKLTPEFGDEFKEILKLQNAFLWPKYLFKETDYTTDTVVSYSDKDLASIVSKLPFFDEENVAAPENAHISEEAGEDGFEIIPETKGSTPIKPMVLAEIKAAVDVLAPEITLSDACFTKADINADDEQLRVLRDNLNKFCSANIIYEFGNESVHVDGTQIKQWCTIDGTNVVLDEEKVKEFVQNLAREHDTFGKKRILRTHDGEEVTVEGGDYGWWMNRGDEAAGLIDAIKTGYKGVRKPIYYGEANSYGANDWGDTYVEINLDKQHLWVYENGRAVIESDFVSGCVNKRTTTPVGTYRITYKERDATLNGENYSSPVDFWMPFNGNVGMHDASWRKEFGGEIYVTSGSHGCINLPTKKAEAIFEIVKKGEPVLVYGGKVLPEEPEEEETELSPEEQLQLLMTLQAAENTEQIENTEENANE